MSEKVKLAASAQKNLQKGQIAKAIKDYQRLVEIDPKDIRNRQKLAELYSRNRQNEEALNEYEAVAKYYSENGFYLKSIAVYKQMQKLDPAEVKFYHRLADLNEKQGLIGNALAEYRTLVHHYEKNEMYSEATKVLQKMKELEPENLNVLVKIAEGYAKTGEEAQSRKEFETVLERLEEKQDHAKIAKLCDMFRAFFPNDVQIPLTGARAKLLVDIQGPGLGELKQLLSGHPDHPEVLRQVAAAYRMVLDFENERATLHHLLKILPEDLDLRQDYVHACLNSGAHRRALEELEDWRETFLEQERTGALKEFYEVLREALPNDENILRILHGLYEKLGDGDKLFDLMTELPEASSEAEEDQDALAIDLDSAEPDPESLEYDSESSLEAALGLAGLDEEELSTAAEESVEVPLEFLEEAETAELPEASIAEEELELELELDSGLEELPSVEPEAEVETEEVLAGLEVIEEEADDVELEFLTLGDDELDESGISAKKEVDSAAVEDQLEEAQFYLQQGLFSEAEELVQKVLARHPENQAAQEKLAVIGESRTQAETPSAATNAAVAPEASAEDELEDFDWEGAPADLGELGEDSIDPEDAESHYNLGIAYKEMGLLDDAVNEFNTAMRNSSRRVDSLTLKGICLMEKGDLPTAEEVFRTGLNLPNLSELERMSLFFEMGLLKEQTGKPKVALQCYQQVEGMDPFFRDVGVKLQQLRQQLGVADKTPTGGPGGAGKKNKISYL